MGTGVRRARLWIAAASIGFGCGEPPPEVPSAVIKASPASVCFGDSYATPIHLDAKDSSAHLTLAYVRPDPKAPPLAFHWTFSGSESEIDDGDVDGDTLIVKIAGDRPLHVRLRVENAEGGVTEALTTISVTPRDPNGDCPLPPPE